MGKNAGADHVELQPSEERRTASIYDSTACDRKTLPDWEWKSPDFARAEERLSHRLMKVELPLINEDHHNFGTLVLMKSVETKMLSHYALRRVEHLRRTLIQTIEKHPSFKSAPATDTHAA